jgi:hypothetical protein
MEDLTFVSLIGSKLFLLRIVVILLMLLFSPVLPGQRVDCYQEVARRLADYGRLTMEWKVDSMLEFTDPQLFEVVPRSVMREQLMGLNADGNIDVRFRSFTVDQIGALIPDEDVVYVPIKIHHEMIMRLLSISYQGEDMRNRLQRMLEKRHGPNNVRYDASRKAFFVQQHKRIFGVRRGPDAPWYFVEYQPENVALLELLVPPPVREKLNIEE